ncbi:4-(cytidine 5'-diphospho)-2-C-methyl-D-erythritol kinase [Xanthomonas oryzae pv. oryzae]|uniref:4-(cytidine 5'-diphospho)-2-C-methyl-D-erythritol kinase n=1 Tax=Xanthomonas oryzae TaxID=347 RepID=UPI0005CF1090|nr:4-(cytidine 5'-diphospho)-2-C-methyl-D-erythritol kinase [Xanthomonas oryzae]AJQ82181.1 4-diphosphocytidyl-2C-methyl-D-erythritol kinase [Xanthomonas oryzae pv. oryzae PXO86]ALZ71005.1 4-(cytidine 5'-diphospho)-2-C-methyl-D-erythritol kinase [Xanthomonas oryzae pv. oryzae]AOS09837.1 4-(cytidine 5'-diphospho)-2-C-methyl-D-erythritol kinase [Xanthomonas oryzae pv. oryzae]AXM31525.1 4-(cytidine 5'-diphospho)-2-C-methyl-D-erythritol kinase [Xanthomonas oryzae pv. oryzae]OMO17340.1 kinase [Xanth
MDRIALMNAPGTDWSAWPAPAKLNLFLQITGRRADGYHLLQTVFRLLDWGDTIHLRVRSDGQILRIGESLPGVAEDDDLVIRAARLLQSAAGAAAGAEIRVDKRIPAGGGFGGGSSDAATVLVALNALWGLALTADTLAELGLQLGADVPVFVRGRNAWAEGVGEQLTPIALPEAAYLLVDPGVHVPTPVLFRSQELTRDAAPAKITEFASGSLLDNAFEPVLRRREPAVEAVFQALSRVGTPRLTGSGSGCFVEFATRAAAEQALAQLPGSLRAWVVEGAAHSPLLDARDAMKV